MAAILRLTTGVSYVRSISGTLTFSSGGVLALADGTAALPSVTFASATGLGAYKYDANSIGIAGPYSSTVAALRLYAGSTPGLMLPNIGQVVWSSTSDAGGSGDTILQRDGAADTLALRRGTNAQTFKIYNTYTNASIFEAGYLYWAANELRLTTFQAGGTDRGITIAPQNGILTSAATLKFSIDNTFDIGASGANRPRNGYFGGQMQIGATSEYQWTNRVTMGSPVDGVAYFRNNAGTGFTRLILGTNDGTANGLGIVNVSGVMKFTTGDGTSRITVDATGYQVSGKSILFATAPTISSGFGSSPSIAANNGTAAFTVNVGTGGTASSGVIGLPTASTGWVCHVQNLTAQAANRASVRTVQTASSTTSVTIQNQNVATGAATAWADSDVLSVICVAY